MTRDNSSVQKIDDDNKILFQDEAKDILSPKQKRLSKIHSSIESPVKKYKIETSLDKRSTYKLKDQINKSPPKVKPSPTF